MSREKQIEEMEAVIESIESNAYTLDWGADARADAEKIAETLYNAGYRKQSEKYLVKENGDIEPLNKQTEGIANNATTTREWISVDERLPEVDTDVLVITANGSFKVARCNIYHNGTLVLWMTNDGLGEKAITHWMPLPEGPKMKGGEEE